MNVESILYQSNNETIDTPDNPYAYLDTYITLNVTLKDYVFRWHMMFTYFNFSTPDGTEVFNNITFMHKQYLHESPPALRDLLFNGTNAYIVDDENHTVNWEIWNGDTTDIERLSFFPRFRLRDLENGTIKISVQHINFHGQYSNIFSLEFEIGDSYYDEPIVTLEEMDIERKGVNGTLVVGLEDYDTLLSTVASQVNISLTDYDASATTVNQAPTNKKRNENNVRNGLIIWLNGTQVYNSFNYTPPVLPTVETKPRITGGSPEDAGYMFVGEHYTMNIAVNNSIHTQINITDGQHTIIFEYNKSIDFHSITWTPHNTYEDYVIGLVDSEKVVIDDMDILSWKFILDKAIIDTGNLIALYNITGYNNTYITNTTSLSRQIYNLGGYVDYTFVNDAGRVTGGEAFEVYAQYNGSLSYAEAEGTFRRLKHVHSLLTLDAGDNDVFDNHENTGRWIVGIKGFDGETETWIDLIYASIDVSEGNINNGLGDDEASIVWEIWWIGATDDLRNQVLRVDFITGYPNCATDVNNELTTSRVWMDFWFNKLNSSTTIGGRINSEYHGMIETGFLFWETWTPMYTNKTASMFFVDLWKGDSSGEKYNAQDFELMKFYTKISKNSPAELYEWRFGSFEILTYDLANDIMSGVDTPVFVETKVINMPQGGFVAPIVKAIQSIGTWVWNGVLFAVKILIGAIDSLLVMMGLPSGMFSSLVNFVSLQLTTMFSWMTTVLLYAQDLLYALGEMLNFTLQMIGYIFSGIRWFVIWVVPLPIHVVTFFVAILTGGTWSYGGVVLLDMTSSAEIIEVFLILLPFQALWSVSMWYFVGEGGDESGMTGIPMRTMQLFKFFRDFYENVFFVFTRIKNEVITMYNFIRSHLPFGSGSGGTSEE